MDVWILVGFVVIDYVILFRMTFVGFNIYLFFFLCFCLFLVDFMPMINLIWNICSSA